MVALVSGRAAAKGDALVVVGGLPSVEAGRILVNELSGDPLVLHCFDFVNELSGEAFGGELTSD